MFPIGASNRDPGVNVLVATFDPSTAPCGRVRITYPLEAGGHAVRYAMERDAVGLRFRLEDLPWADVVVTQRGFPRPNMGALLERILAAGKPVVYEIDDCLPEVPDYLGKPYYREWGPGILAWAAAVDAVTVSTPALAEYFTGRAKRVFVLRNYLSDRIHSPGLHAAKSSDDRIEIGFVGSPDHRISLAPVAAALRRVLERRPEVRLTFVGGAPEGFTAGERVRLLPPDWNYDEFPARLARLGFDIALAPMVDDRFSSFKSNLKYLDNGALGIPGVFSRVRAYDTVRDGETGLLCDASPDAWEAAIERLCADAALRRRIGEAARADVRGNWMVSSHAHLWTEAYSELLSRRQP